MILIILIAAGCNGRQAGLTYPVVRSAFTERIKTTGTVRPVKTTNILTPPVGIATVSYLAENGQHVRRGDTLSVLEVPELTDRLENMRSNLEQVRSNKQKLEADNALELSMLEAQINTTGITVDLNSLDSVQQKFAPPLQQKLIALELQKANLEKKKLERKYASRKIINETELRGLNSRIRRMESHIERISDMVDKLTVLAPAEGIVMRTESPVMRFSSSTGSGTIGGKIKEGSTVYQSMPLLEMPDMEMMQIVAEVSERDFKRIEPGQEVFITVDAAGYFQTSGSVKHKSLAGKRIANGSGVKEYEVIISIDSCDATMKPGLSASCEIMVHDIPDTLVVPSIAVFEENDQKFVYVESGRKYQRIPVGTGLNSGSLCIITEGLREGEKIALARPPANMIRQPLPENLPDAGKPLSDTIPQQKQDTDFLNE